MNKNHLLILLLFIISVSCSSEKEESRTVVLLDKDWYFHNGEVVNGEKQQANMADWEQVTVPHDWAISGKFDKLIDAQKVLVVEDGEKVAQLRSGRTGALPHIGIGWYQKTLNIPQSCDTKRIHVEFDGAMSHAKVYMNGKYVDEWPYGYTSFNFDITDFVEFGKPNLLAVRLENKPSSSRWYPGAGLYRNVRMVLTNAVSVKPWGTFVTTPDIKQGQGRVNVQTTIQNQSESDKQLTLLTKIFDKSGKEVAEVSKLFSAEKNKECQINQNLTIDNPTLWSVDTPVLYKAISYVMDGNKELDCYETTFGFRYFEFTGDSGFFLNGKHMKLNGVCLHHDLGPLGAAVNVSAIRRQLEMLKDMGCNAIRTSHNPPTPELLNLCDEMGFLVIDEAFDEWKKGKRENGYNTLWDEWAEKDMVALIHRDRNHPSVILWSIGNEIPEQNYADGYKLCQFLVDICKREDSTRLTTSGFHNWENAIKNGFADIVDVPGWNYKPQHYKYIHENHPEWPMIGSETASTVSSRGEYFLPAVVKVHYTREPYHCSSYDLEYPRWASSPDTEFAAQDSFPFMAGEFVWTGFDYLGEPTPYNAQWPARSSYFGIIDLCGIPKDRYYLYQSKWSDKDVLHLLPHWNWEGKEGETIPVHCYTSFNKAELFLNGKSLGVHEKDPTQLYRKYRLVWDVPYEPGELKVVALDENNNPVKEAFMRTAGKPAAIKLEAYKKSIQADGKELDFITVSVVDSAGTVCPTADNLIDFTVDGVGTIKAVGNGDPTSLESFVEPHRKAFNGKCMVYVQNTGKQGKIFLTATSEGLTPTSIELNCIRN